jgi:putative transposase
MSRPPRAAEGGLVYHAMNRGNAGVAICDDDGDYEAFRQVLAEAVERHAMRLLAYCVLADHFQLVLWPRADGDLSEFMRWLTMTHTQRWHAQHHSAGSGHLFQGRFKSFPVQDDGHLVTICRYVERSALNAGLVARAEDWPWGSLRQHGRGRKAADPRIPALSPWPIERPRRWAARVNAALRPAEEEAMQRSLQRGQPLGTPEWQADTAARLGLESTFRPRGRPRKSKDGS